MAAKLKELRESRATTWSEMRGILESSEDTGMSAEEHQKYDRLEAELDRLTKDLDARTRAEELEKRLADPQPTPDIPDPKKAPGIDDERAYRKAFRKYVLGEQISTDDRRILEKRAMSVGTGSAGGYLVPEQFANQIYEVMKWYGGMRQAAGSITSSSGGDLLYPNVDDTGNVGEIIDENTAFNTQDVTVGARLFKAFLYSSKIVKVSWSLMQDSAIDLDTLLARLLGIRLGRIQNTGFTNGAGGTEPEGITTNAPTVTAADDTTIAFEDLMSLVYSVDPAYRPNGMFMMADGITSAIRKLRWSADGTNFTGGFLWEPSLQNGQPDRLLGYPVVPNNDMQATVAASKKTVIFGDIEQGYLIRDVKDVTLVRLNELYAGSGQVGFLAFARADGQPRFPATVTTQAPYKALIQHS
jgi:HK97 family phage major capsid protein